MLRRLARASALLLALCAAPALGEDTPVVVELFTSQGCSSCPPADKIMHQLAERDDVIALALHVDYWDYIGWKDPFAEHEYTERQQAYAEVAGRRSVYTPQMIVNGEASVVGARAMELADAIRDAESRPAPVDVDLSRNGENVAIRAEMTGRTAPMLVHTLRYVPHAEVKITRGENAGRTLGYSNIVRDWTVLGEWDGQEAFTRRVAMPGSLPVVVLVQEAPQGRILGAAALR